MDVDTGYAISNIVMPLLSLLIFMGIIVLAIRFVMSLLSFSPEGLIGWACIGSTIVGILSLAFACLFCIRGDSVGGGLCFIASAVAFGWLADAMLKK
ncbi:MAG: hypothetical protein P9L94_09555 [Candidatus Hinthialibacter antarcticus]|nr:hypothetical protein [Candidatus Hinthialibacter antarcticus]